MRTTYFWYSIDFKNAFKLPEFLKSLGEMPFEDSRGYGFDIEEVGSSELKCRYIKKDLFLDVALDPFGNRIENRRVSYRDIKFMISLKHRYLMVASSAKNISQFIESIEEFAELELIQMCPDIDSLIQQLSLAGGSTVRVVALSTSKFLLRSRTACVIKFASLVDIREDVTSFLQNRKYEISQIQASFDFSGQVYSISASSAGRCTLNCDLFDRESKRLRSAIVTAMKRHHS